MANIDFDELAKKSEYSAAVSEVATRDAALERHMKIVTFYALVVFSFGVITILFLIVLGIISTTPENQVWAKDGLKVFVPAALGYAIGRHTPSS